MKPEEKQAAKDIQEITGIGNSSAQAIISVIGADMERFPTDRHLASWAGLCPGDHESAKKRKNGKTRMGNALLRSTLVICAHSAVKNKKSYFYAQFMRISAHRGEEARICSGRPFDAHSDIPHSERRSGIQGSWGRIL